ncbi:MAG: hypothetical protein ACOC93_01905 [Planctomycetota bacterium]
MNASNAGPSRAGYLLAALVAIAGVAVAVGVIVHIFTEERTIGRLRAPGRVTLQLPEAGDYDIYHEYKTVVDGEIVSQPRDVVEGLRLTIRPVGGDRRVPLEPMAAETNYNLGSRSGVGVYEFTIDQPGEYEFTANWPEAEERRAMLIIQPAWILEAILSGLAGAAAALAGGAMAIVIAVVTFTRRQRARRLRPEGPPPLP